MRLVIPASVRRETVVSVIRGDETFEAAASRLGVSVDEVRAWSLLMVTPSRRSARWPLVIALASVAIAVGVVPAAWAQTCPQTLPAPMVTLCPNAPALASQLNGNFQASANRDSAAETRITSTEARLSSAEGRLTATENNVSTKLGAATGVALQSPVTIPAAGCSGNEVVSVTNSGTGALGCRSLFGDLVTDASTFRAVRNNSGGTTSTNMIGTGEGFCFLTEVGFEDLDSGGEVADCKVVRNGSTWRLDAYLSNTPDADAYCEATCLRIR